MNIGENIYCGVCLHPRVIGERYLVEKCENCGDEEYTLSLVSVPPTKDHFAGEDRIWCGMCQDWIDRSELKIWTGDDARHHLCPGCDSDLLPVERME